MFFLIFLLKKISFNLFFAQSSKKYSQPKIFFIKKFRFKSFLFYICELKLDEFLLFLAEKTHKKVSNLSCLKNKKNKNNNSI